MSVIIKSIDELAAGTFNINLVRLEKCPISPCLISPSKFSSYYLSFLEPVRSSPSLSISFPNQLFSAHLILVFLLTYLSIIPSY